MDTLSQGTWALDTIAGFYAREDCRLAVENLCDSRA